MPATERRLGRLGPFRLRKRAARVRASQSYRPLVAAIVLLLVFTISMPEAPWARAVLVIVEGCTLLIASRTAGLVAHGRMALRGLVVATVGVAVVGFFLTGTTGDGAGWLAGTLLLAGTAAVIVVGVTDQDTINQQSISGAICVYLLLGLVFEQIYAAVAAIGSGPFFAQGTDGTTGIRAYFSYVTLATLGYGDYTPAASLGRTLVVIEALLGQLYLVTVVAVLVSRVGRSRVRPGPTDGD